MIRESTQRESSTVLRAPLGVYAVIAVASVIAMIGVWAWYVVDNPLSPIPAIIGVLLLVLVALGLLVQGKAWQMIVNISPTALLMAVFPTIITDLNSHIIIVLMVAVTVPWASSAAVMPVYQPLMNYPRSDQPAFFYGFARLWPTVTALAMIPVAFFTIVMTIITGWGFGNIALYTVGLLSNIVFAHSLIPAQEARRFGFVFTGWLIYAVALLVIPQLWFVLPLLGVVPQLLLLGRSCAGLLNPMPISMDEALKYVVYGFFIGSVLWADKFFLIALHPRNVDILMVYVALIPIVIALAVYYATQYPVLQNSFEELIRCVNSTPINQLRGDVGVARTDIARSAVGTICVSTVSGLAVLLMTRGFNLSHNLESLVLFLLPPVLLALYLGIMQLSQMQRNRFGAVCGAVYVVAVCVAFALSTQLVGLVTAMVTAGVLAMIAARRVQLSVSDAPYELFWQKAVVW